MAVARGEPGERESGERESGASAWSGNAAKAPPCGTPRSGKPPPPHKGMARRKLNANDYHKHFAGAAGTKFATRAHAYSYNDGIVARYQARTRDKNKFGVRGLHCTLTML